MELQVLLFVSFLIVVILNIILWELVLLAFDVELMLSRHPLLLILSVLT